MFIKAGPGRELQVFIAIFLLGVQHSFHFILAIAAV